MGSSFIPPSVIDGTVLAANKSTTSTVYVDTLLTSTVGPGTWLMEVNCQFRNSGAAPGWKIQTTHPGATFLSGRRWNKDGGGLMAIFLHDQASGESQQTGTDDGGGGLGGFVNTYTVAVSSVFTIQVAQNVSDAAATNLLLGSSIRMTKLD